MMLAKTGFKTACLAGIAALFSSAAVAADFGGACCQDLEERIAELEATTARKGNRKVSLTVYGQVNYAILHVDGLGISDTTITNNSASQTRFGLKGDAKISPDWSAGYLIEIGLGSADDLDLKKGVPQVVGDGVYNDGLVIRHSALYLMHEQLGTVWLGKTSTATDGIAEISVANVGPASTLLNLEPLSGTYFGGLNLPFDGGRTDVLKWISPTFAGFSVSAAWMANDSSEDAWDVALRYAGELGGFRLAAGIGYRQQSTDYEENAEVISGSASVMHITSGLFVNVAAGKMDGNVLSDEWWHWSNYFNWHRDGAYLHDMRAIHLQGGIEQSLFSFGRTTLYGEWARIEFKGTAVYGIGDEDAIVKSGDDTVDFWGLGVVQSIDAAAMDLYLGYRNYDDGNAETVIGGAIIRF